MKNHLSRSFWPRLAAGAILMATLNFSLFLAANQTIIVPATTQTSGSCTVVNSSSSGGFSGNQINNASFLQVPSSASKKLYFLQWEGRGYNEYTYYNTSDANNFFTGGPGWYSGTAATTVTWNPNQAVVLDNGSPGAVTLTLNGTPAPPPATPWSYYGFGEWNVYAYDGNTGDTLNNTPDPDPNGMFGGDPVSILTGISGTPFNGSVSVGPVTIGSSLASVSYSFDFSDGGSGYPLGYPLGNGPNGPITLQLNNPGTAADEVRLDWDAAYQANSANTMSGFTITISGTLSGASPFWEVAGQVTILDSLNLNSTYTAAIGILPGSLYPPAGVGGAGWIGSTASGSFSYTGTLLFSTPHTFPNGDHILVQGYVDLIVDPGNITVQIQANPEPQISRSGSTATVFWPAVNGWSLQQNTNLATATWTSSSGVTTSNGTNYLNLTLSQGSLFFRLVGP